MKTRLRNLLWVFMALTLLLAGTTLVRAYDISFSDVPESSWFYEDVMTLSESGVVSGYPDGTYRPTKKVTTGESLKMILLAAGYPEPERAESHWARGCLTPAPTAHLPTPTVSMSKRSTPLGLSAATRMEHTVRTRPSPARRSPRSSTASIRALTR